MGSNLGFGRQSEIRYSENFRYCAVVFKAITISEVLGSIPVCTVIISGNIRFGTGSTQPLEFSLVKICDMKSIEIQLTFF